MAMILEQNDRGRQLFCLQGHFVSRSKPFWHPKDLTHFVPFDCLQGRRSGQALLRWRTLRYRHILAARRLALNEFAPNLEGVFNRS